MYHHISWVNHCVGENGNWYWTRKVKKVEREREGGREREGEGEGGEREREREREREIEREREHFPLSLSLLLASLCPIRQSVSCCPVNQRVGVWSHISDNATPSVSGQSHTNWWSAVVLDCGAKNCKVCTLLLLLTFTVVFFTTFYPMNMWICGPCGVWMWLVVSSVGYYGEYPGTVGTHLHSASHCWKVRVQCRLSARAYHYHWICSLMHQCDIILHDRDTSWNCWNFFDWFNQVDEL